jgi:DNA-binding transcriptional ArsR family regulator
MTSETDSSDSGPPFGDRDGALVALFDLLSEETRLRIVSVLAAHEHANPTAAPLGFDVLRERVGARDSGRFNYHLRKLDGPLVEKVDGGYRLTPMGREIVTIVSEVPVGAAPEAGSSS